ncbi:hypothetical protein GS601_21940 [Myxacorys almedinensis A]|uniref:Uncharacterized protein n=2 Tax=Myxacorys TaxID=2056239 RepID=A0A8J8CNT5_9CYAN|nr:hypothetical protein [Myxacorys almedinensis A]
MPKRYACPSEVEPLVTLMLGSLAGYTNRAIARSTSRENVTRSYVVTVGRPEFEPLPLSPDRLSRDGTSGHGKPVGKPDSTLRQVFITTLERERVAPPQMAAESDRPSGRNVVYLQGFHWLFLTRTEDEWRLALLFTQIGTYPTKQSPTPPRESSQGVIGQAIQTWLRDCNAGAIPPAKSDRFFNKTR